MKENQEQENQKQENQKVNLQKEENQKVNLQKEDVQKQNTQEQNLGQVKEEVQNNVPNNVPNNVQKNNKKTLPIVVGAVCVLGVGGFLVYNHFTSTKTVLILNNTVNEFKNEFEEVNESNAVLTSAKNILDSDYTFKVGTKTDDMFFTIDYTKETNSYDGLVSVYGFTYNLELGELPVDLTTKGLQYDGQSKTTLDEIKLKYTKEFGKLVLNSEVSNEKASDKVYDREIKFLINKDELKTLIDAYNTETSDLMKNQIIPELTQQINSSLGINLNPSTFEEYYNSIAGFSGLIIDSDVQSDIELTLLTDDKKVKEIVISRTISDVNDTTKLTFEDVNNYLNSVTTVSDVIEGSAESIFTLTPVFNQETWGVTADLTETSSGTTYESTSGVTWNLNQPEDNVVFEYGFDGELYSSTFTLKVDENQNIYYNKQGTLFDIVATLSSKEVAE